MPLLSVIIPTYNRERFLACALDSVLAQDFKNYQLIVADDGSTDGTPALLAGEMGRDCWAGRLCVLRQENSGPGVARNLALRHARGEYCVFLDSDDLLFPWSLSVIAEAIDIGGRPSILIGHEAQFMSPDPNAIVPRDPLRISRWNDLYSYGHTGPTGTLIARTEAIMAVGGFMAERIVGEDSDLMLRLGTLPNLIKIESPHTYSRRLHSQNFSGSQKRWAMGAMTMIRRYQDGAFPGGPERKAEVRRLVAGHVNYYTLYCLRSGAWWEGIKLYLKTFAWFAGAGRYDHILQTPLYMVLYLLRPCGRRAKRWKAGIVRRGGRLKAFCTPSRRIERSSGSP